MSAPQFTKGQQVQIQTPHGHFNQSETVYHIASINRISGMYSAQLLQDSICVGAIPINNLIAFKK